MDKKIITTSEAPAAIGPYSQAIRVGEFLYTSGQISLDPNSMELITGNIEVETERVLKNIEAITVYRGNKRLCQACCLNGENEDPQTNPTEPEKE